MTGAAARLAVGTVQFGLEYGVANRHGKVGEQEAANILAVAAAAGVDTIDTAASYGDSEAVLGRIGVRHFAVVSKVPPVPPQRVQLGRWVTETVGATLLRLDIPRLDAILLHRPQDLLDAGGDALYEALAELKVRGLVRRLGISVYDPQELDRLMGRFALDLVQAPFNVLDRRVESSGWLERLTTAGVEVHTRSAFLQGLLLMDDAARPQYFSRWPRIWQQWRHWLDETGLSATQACLGFVLSRQQIARVIVGVDNLEQLRQLLAAAEGARPQPPAELWSEDAELVNPSRWPRQ